MIVFVARYRSGKDGAAAIDTNYLIEVIAFEDQGKLREALDSESQLSPDFEPKPRFFSAQRASELLLKIDQFLSHGKSIPESVDMPASTDLARTFERAQTLMQELNHKQVEPLHLLAAALNEECEATRLLRGMEVTREQVIAALEG